jgi:hypothetical protein
MLGWVTTRLALALALALVLALVRVLAVVAATVVQALVLVRGEVLRARQAQHLQSQAPLHPQAHDQSQA